MKRVSSIILPFLAGVILAGSVAIGAAGAADDQTRVDVYDQQKKLVKSVVFAIGVPKYWVNDDTTGVPMDVAPYTKEGRTMVPVRFLGHALGVDDGNITWDDASRTATLRLGDVTASMTIGKKAITVNGQTKTIDAAPELKRVQAGRGDRTMLTARYVAEALGYEVAWDEKNQIVQCWPKGEPQPAVPQAVVEQVADTKKPGPVKQVEQTLGIKMEPPQGKYDHSWSYFYKKNPEQYGDNYAAHYKPDDDLTFIDVYGQYATMEDWPAIEKVLTTLLPTGWKQVYDRALAEFSHGYQDAMDYESKQIYEYKVDGKLVWVKRWRGAVTEIAIWHKGYVPQD